MGRMGVLAASWQSRTLTPPSTVFIHVLQKAQPLEKTFPYLTNVVQPTTEVYKQIRSCSDLFERMTQAGMNEQVGWIHDTGNRVNMRRAGVQRNEKSSIKNEFAVNATKDIICSDSYLLHNPFIPLLFTSVRRIHSTGPSNKYAKSKPLNR